MNDFLKSILDFIYGLVNNYGLSIVLFTIFIRLCVLPLDYKSRKGMRKMNTLLPKQAEIQKKYGHDQDKMNRKMQELYKKEGASPLSGCWPMLVSMPILFAMFYALRAMSNEQLASQAFDILLNGEPRLEPFLWLKNLWMPDSPFASSWPNLQSLMAVEQKQWLTVFNTLSADQVAQLGAAINIPDLSAASFLKDGKVLQGTVQAIGDAMAAMPSYQQATAGISYMTIPLVNWSVSNTWNGLLILPILSAVSQFLTTKATQQDQPAPAANDEKAQQQQANSNFMKWFFPIFSLVICLTSNAAFALYWVVSNLVHMAMNAGINWYLERQDKLAAEKPAAEVKGGLK